MLYYMHCPAWQILCNPACIRAAIQIKPLLLLSYVLKIKCFMSYSRTDNSTVTTLAQSIHCMYAADMLEDAKVTYQLHCQ